MGEKEDDEALSPLKGGEDGNGKEDNNENDREADGAQQDAEDAVTGLDLSSQQLVNLAPTIGLFTNITTLNISGNMVSKLPPEIGRLAHLERLDASSNKLLVIPKEIGRLHQLRFLDLHSNLISVLPMEMGRLVRLETLLLSQNNITYPPAEVIANGVKPTVFWLRDNIPAAGPAPPRRWVTVPAPRPAGQAQESSVKVMCYNVLAPSYATESMYPHCQSWALGWDFRSKNIVHEVLTYGADVICLQEVEIGSYENLFLPQLGQAGYGGVYKPKSRYNTMPDHDRKFVDGCAIFWKTAKFNLHSQHLVDFVEQTMARGEAFLNDHDAFNRLISKDNIGLVAILEMQGSSNSHSASHFPSLADAQSSPSSRKGGAGEASASGFNPLSKYLLICNTHIHWNPELSDVKLMQTQLLIEEVQKLIPRKMKMPVVICGDFNSTPDSGVWAFLRAGHLPADHEDFGDLQWGHYKKDKDGKIGAGCKHHLKLESAYMAVQAKEPKFTNASFQFRGCLSYIWYSKDLLRANGVLETFEDSVLEDDIAMPNTRFPSDHMSLMAEMVFLDGGDGAA